MKQIYAFTTDEKPELTQVGGKAMSLILTTRHGLPVPPGFVLTVAFFNPWLEQIRQTPEWSRALTGLPTELRQNTEALERRCTELELTNEQKTALDQALQSLIAQSGAALFAVRSSSPEEDLEELSFAGGYETTLGVTEATLLDALRNSFASCFAERVWRYKEEHGLPVDRPRIAVIVQQQIRAETAGVAFSLNPINNCYDEVVINGNFGLGESVVAGLVSPDTFIVDKVSRTIIEKKLGKKETAIWLAPGGGTYEESSSSYSTLCLSDAQVLELAEMTAQVERYYDKPMDIEWAFSAEKLYLLQARPITAYVPLPEGILTAPGEPKKLYIDYTLTKWGMQKPLTVMGTDYLNIANTQMLKLTMGPDTGPDVVNETRRTIEGRTYLVVSNSIKMQGKDRVAGEFREMDSLTADILAHIDEAEYIPKQTPPPLKGAMRKMLIQNLGFVRTVIQAIRDPEACKQRYLEEEKAMVLDLALVETVETLSMREFAIQTMERLIDYTRIFMAALFAAIIARSRVKALFKKEGPEVTDQLVYLERALPHNVTIQMGLAMYRLASFAEIKECPSGKLLADRLANRDFTPEFLQAWETFMKTYGFRSPMEMDPGASRFYERTEQFFEQVRVLSENTDTENNPQAIYERAKKEREQAYETLLQVAQNKGKRKAKRFAKDYATWIDLGGLRESPKYHLVYITDLFRRRALKAAHALVDAGRLDHPEQVFDLHIDELDQALADSSLDLRALAEKNTRFLNRFRQVRELPRVVDSRGKILRLPPKEAGEGELAGEPISPGVVRGKVKVLHEPNEKPVLPGEILVARATDPGWTPLFINASGVILEVGGMLQHGALVAREYGKPCVAGIDRATQVLQDGQLVELDGTNGLVRLEA